MTGQFVAEINEALLWQSEDGREAWCNFWPEKGQVFICTDIHRSNTVPEQAVGFDAEALRRLADRLDELCR